MPTIDELASQVAALEQQMAAITTPPDKYYTSIYSGEEIDAAITKVRSGAMGVSSFNGRAGAVMPQAGDYNDAQIPVSADAGAETVAAALNNKPNRNLLDNWYFGNPVNQRGLTSYGPTTDNYHGIDRWLINSGTMSLEPDGLVLTGPGIIIQRFENLDLSVGEYVFSCLTADGCFSAPLTAQYVNCGPVNVTRDVSTENLYVSFANSTKLKAFKLELGSQQTLAHQDEDGNWVLNEIPDYGAELAKCQRYFWRLYGNCGYLAVGSISNLAYAGIPFPVAMRVKPSVSAQNLVLFNANSGTNIPVTVQTVYGDASKDVLGTTLELLSEDNGITPNGAYTIQSGSIVDFSAEL